MLTLHFYTELKISTRFCWKRYFCGKRNQMLLLSPPATPPPPTLPAPPPPRASLQCIWVRLVIRELAVCSCWWMIPVRILSVVSLFPSLSPSHSFFFSIPLLSKLLWCYCCCCCSCCGCRNKATRKQSPKINCENQRNLSFQNWLLERFGQQTFNYGQENNAKSIALN